MPILATIPEINSYQSTTGGVYVDGFSGANHAAQVTAAKAYADLGDPTTLVFTQGLYTFSSGETFDFRPHAVKTFDGGGRSTQFNFTNPTQGQTLVTLGGEGNDIQGLWVTSGNSGDAATKFSDLVGMHFVGVTNSSIKQIQVRLYGLNTIGMKWSGTNSNVNVETANMQAAMPFHFYGGTSMTFENLDLTCGNDPANASNPGTTGANVWAQIQGDAATTFNGVLFGGSGQKGHYATYFNSTDIVTKGELLTLKMYRDEQAVALPSTRYFINQYLTGGTDDGLENLRFDGVRAGGDGTTATDVRGVTRWEEIGSFLANGAAGGSQTALSLHSIQDQIDALP